MTLRVATLPRLIDRITVVVVLAVLALPSIDAMTRSVDERSSLQEQRTPAPLPEFPTNFAEFSTWMRRFDTHFRDTFGARDWLLTAHQGIAMSVMPRDPSPRIVHGREGWLYWDPANARAVHRGALPFTSLDLDKWVEGLEERRKTCEALGARYFLALVPAKETTYPDYFPPAFAPIGPTRDDQLAERPARTSSLNFVDLRSVMIAERAFDVGGDRTYSRLGSHWTHRGAGAASRVLLTALALSGQTVPPREFWQFTLREEEGESLADLNYVADQYREPLFGVMPIEPDPGTWSVFHEAGIVHAVMDGARPELPHLVLVHDSFAAWILPFLAPSFGRIEAVGGRTLPVRIVHWLQPDIVIDLHTEHVLDTWGLPPPIPARPTSPRPPRGLQTASESGLPRLTPLTDEEFTRCERLVGEVDVASSKAIELRGGVRTFPRSESPNAGVDIEFNSTEGLLVIDESATSAKQLALHVRVATRDACEMWVLWRPRAERDFNRVNLVTVALRAGENDLRLAIDGVIEPGALGLKLPNGRYTISAIEVRAR